ncbi:MAG TPA: hypothetical protein K8V23_02980 [Lactobacillus crispatus]|uniref:Uncharacterized protein n=1 Tax=Lactobacillus crispatus TaxID=47770 RepID=A0A921FGS0_9LACO|nr:hypothetical protein [Lactobacillus crispatus]
MENMLNAIKDMPLKAAYYMGKRDAYRKELADTLSIAKVKTSPVLIGRIKVYYLLADMYDEQFAEEMGWV